MNKSILILIFAAFALTLSAQQHIRAIQQPLEHIQPNGDTLVYRLHGDEHRHWQTTLDGYLIKKNKRGKFCYAKKNRRGEVKATCRTAHNAEDRTRREARYVERHIPNGLKD